MKKMVMMVMVLVMMVGFTACGQASKSEKYAMTTVVSEVNYETDEVICLDFNGFEWKFNGCEDWMVGDIASLLMDDCGTVEILDDEIISAKYGGWISGSWGWDGSKPIVE